MEFVDFYELLWQRVKKLSTRHLILIGTNNCNRRKTIKLSRNLYKKWTMREFDDEGQSLKGNGLLCFRHKVCRILYFSLTVASPRG